MTASRLDPSYRERMSELDPADPSGEDALSALLEASPDLQVHTSAAANLGFILGLTALVASPFSLLMALSAGLAAVALVVSVVGLARASRAVVAGTVLASAGLVLSLLAGTVVGLRYVGIDTTVGDATVPGMHDALVWLNSLLPPT